MANKNRIFHFISTWKRLLLNKSPMMVKLTAVLLSSAIISGCTILDHTDAYPPMPQQNVNKDALDPPVKTETKSLKEPITLAHAIDIALANNPRLAASSYYVQAAKAQHDIAIGEILPKLDLVGSYSSFREDRLIKPRRPGTSEVLQFTDQLASNDIVLKMPLFMGGQLINEIRATKLLQVATEHRLARDKEELVFNISSVFYSILSQIHVIKSLEFSQKTLQEHKKRVGELIQALKAARVDQLRTEVRLADLEQQLAREQNVLAIENRVLCNLMGLQKEAFEHVSVTGKLSIHETSALDVEESLANALRQRNDYLAERAALEAQAKRVDASRGRYLPTLNLEGSYGNRWDANSTNNNDDVGSVVVGINFPIFAGGRINAKVRQERSILAAFQNKLHDLELQIRLDVETAILNMASSHKRVKATEKSIEQAQESLRIECEKYDFAKGSITDVLDAQSALLDSQMNYYRALADYNTSLAQYRLAVGEEQ